MGDPVTELEAELEALDAQIALSAANYTALEPLSAKRVALEAKLEDAMTRWLALEERR